MEGQTPTREVALSAHHDQTGLWVSKVESHRPGRGWQNETHQFKFIDSLNNMRLLIAADDETQAQALQQLLERQGYTVAIAPHGKISLALLERSSYDLVLIALQKPELTVIHQGLQRRGIHLPILILSSHLSPEEQAEALTTGASACMKTPVDESALCVWIQALSDHPGQVLGLSGLHWGDLSLDYRRQQIFFKEELIGLSPCEYRFVELFLRHPHQVLGASAIVEHLWDVQQPSVGTVRTHIKRLRRKLERAGVPEMIETVYGVGYRLKRAPDVVAPIAESSPASSKRCAGLSPSRVVLDAASPKSPILLIVDADRNLRPHWLSEANKRSLKPIVVHDCQTAQYELAQQIPDLILLDLEFPHHAVTVGETFLESIQQHHHNIPTIVYSQRDQLSTRAATLSLCQAFLSKNTPMPEVFDVACELLHANHFPQAKLLIVDNEQFVLRRLAQMLQPWGLNIHLLQDPRQFWDVLAEFKPDLLLLDMQMPYYDGRQLCRIVRQDPHWRNLPIIFLSRSDRPDLIYQIYESGADDYLAKPVDELQLRSRLLSHLKRNNTWDNRTDTDRLTQLMNRRRATQELHRYLRLAQRDQCSFCFVLMSIREFSGISEQYGHRVGELALTYLSRLLRQQFRREDIIARWEENEFLISIYGMNRTDAIGRLNRLLTVVKQTPLITGEQQFLSLGVGVGLAVYPEQGQDIAELHRSAKADLQDLSSPEQSRIQLS